MVNKFLQVAGIQKILASKNLNNAVWSTLEVIIYPLFLIFTTPYFIKQLGIDQYGVWMLINSIIASIGVLNLGLGDATIKFVSKYKALENPDQVKNVIESSYSIYLILALVVVLVGFGYSELNSLFNWFHVTDENQSTINVSIKLGAITLSIKFIEQIFLAVFKGLARYDIAAKLSIFLKSSVLLSNVIMVYLGYKLISIFTVSAIVSAFILLVDAVFIKLYVRNISFVPTFKRSSIKEIFSFSLWSWIQSVFIIVASQVDKFIVAAYAGVTVLAYYTIGYLVYSQLHNVFAVSVSWLFPVVSAKVERKENIDILYQRMLFLLTLFGLASMLILYLLRDFIFTLWLGKDSYINSQDFIVGFICYEIIFVITIIPFYFLNGTGLVKLNTLFEVLLKTTNIVCMYLMFKFFGVQGIVYGLILSVIIYAPIQNYITIFKIYARKEWVKSILLIVPSLSIVTALNSEIKLVSIALITFAFIMLWLVYARTIKTES